MNTAKFCKIDWDTFLVISHFILIADDLYVIWHKIRYFPQILFLNFPKRDLRYIHLMHLPAIYLSLPKRC